MKPRTTTRHRQALRRVVMFMLLVVMPVVIVASHLATVFGPLHTHDPALLASDPHSAGSGSAPTVLAHHAHLHAHGGFERHWHLAGDSSVILIGLGDADESDGDGAKTRAKASLPLGPLVAEGLHVSSDASQARPAQPTARWTSPSPARIERPPRG